MTLIICTSAFTVTFGWFFPLKKRVVITHFTEQVMSFLLRWVCNVRVEIHSPYQHELDEFIRQKRALVVVCNHQSQWETFFFQSFLPPLVTVLKRELVFIPLLGWALACYKPIILHRSKKVASVRRVQQQGKERLAEGLNVLIFPQSTRLAPGEVGAVTNSPAKLAVDCQAVVVPIVHNAGKFWKKKGMLIYPGVIQVTISQPIDGRNTGAKEIARQYQALFKEKISLQKESI